MAEETSDELKLHEQWQKEAKDMTIEKLPEFLKRLMDHQHDYGTICRAIAAAGIAAMWAIERGSQGGITGFQASCIMWDVIDGWGTWGKGPKRMHSYSNMLYPQYESSFRSITPDTWEWLQLEARKNLENNEHAVGGVTAHWQTIADGKVPFGYRVEES